MHGQFSADLHEIWHAASLAYALQMVMGWISERRSSPRARSTRRPYAAANKWQAPPVNSELAGGRHNASSAVGARCDRAQWAA